MVSSNGNLLSRAGAGDREALVKLLEEHSPMVRRHMERRIPRRWRAVVTVDDLMQQTFTDAYLNMTRFEPRDEEAFASWLLLLARCNLLDALRALRAEKRGGDRRRIEPRTPEDSFTALYDLLGGTTQTTPSRALARDEACAAVRRAIERLPHTYRRVVEMYDIDGCSAAQVAAALGRSRGAVYMIRARAHRLLAEMLGGASRFLSVT